MDDQIKPLDGEVSSLKHEQFAAVNALASQSSKTTGNDTKKLQAAVSALFGVKARPICPFVAPKTYLLARIVHPGRFLSAIVCSLSLNLGPGYAPETRLFGTILFPDSLLYPISRS